MTRLNIFTALLFLQEKNAGYFNGMQASIMNFIEINWSHPIRIDIKNTKIPKQLRQDIEEFLMPLNNTESTKKISKDIS